ncbi:hypothetical protein CH333_05760, partial [candidate division WOR-3 bacterium JGI_Cruoil_03_44_89]
MGFDAVESCTYRGYYKMDKSGFDIDIGVQTHVPPFYYGVTLANLVSALTADSVIAPLDYKIAPLIGGWHLGLALPHDEPTTKLNFSLFKDFSERVELTYILEDVSYTYRWNTLGVSISGGVSLLKERIESGFFWEPRCEFEEWRLHASVNVFMNRKYIKPYLRGGVTYEIRGDNDKTPKFEPFISIGLQLSTPTPYLYKEPKVPHTRTYTGSSLVEKPNIYLYPEGDTTVYVRLIPKEGNFITKSLPPYEDGWCVDANSRGKLNGMFDYLYYEGKLVNTPPVDDGWCVGLDSIWNFFEERLRRYGFNEKEISDFVEYWQIHLPKTRFYLVFPLYT